MSFKKAIRQAAIERYKRFMALRASGHQIRTYVARRRLVPDLPRLAKSQMAEQFAAGTLPFNENLVQELEKFFKTR